MKFHKTISTLLTGATLVAMLSACSSGSSAPAGPAPAAPAASSAPQASAAPANPAPAAKTEPSGEVRMLVAVTGGKDEAEMKLFEKALSEKTGLTIIMEKPPSDYDNVLVQKLQGGEQYDLVYGNLRKLAMQGALMDITDRVANSEILSKNIEASEWEDIKYEGKIYGGFNKKEIHRVVALNNVILKAAGIDYKTIEHTLDGYYNVFKKLREANSEKDFYPLNVVMKDVWDIQPWMASVGLKDGIKIDTDGKRYAEFASDASAPVWEWFKKLYDEKLLDPASFVDQSKDLRAKMGAASKKTAVAVDWAAWVGLHNANALTEGVTPDQYEIVSLPGVKTPSGEYMLGKGDPSTFSIPANAKNPDGAFKILEFFATQEGGEMLSVGLEGNDYTIENGKYTLTDLGKKHSSDHGAPIPIFKDFVHPVGYNPGVEEALSYGKYASVNMQIPNDTPRKEAMGKWAIQMIKGDVSISDGLAGMRKELVSLDITDK